jgi:OmpA-OmpF porin, OOP family
MRIRGARAAGLYFGVGVITASSAAIAQEVPYDPAVDVQLFEYSVGPKTYFAVDDGSIAADKQLAFDLMVTFLTHPFTVYNVSDDQEQIENERTEVVKSLLAGEIGAAYGIGDKWQLNVALPLIFNMAGDGISPETATPAMEDLQITGLGDLRVEMKTQLWTNGAMRLGGAAGLTLPSSFGAGGNDYLGDDLPSARARGSWNWTGMDGKLSTGVNLGVILRKPRTIYASEVGQQLTWGVAAAYRPVDRFSVVGESFGRTGLGTFDVDSSPMEVGGGLRVLATKALAVVLGGSAGVISGIGSPDLRVFASVGYAPDTRDSDGDGVPNNRDRCTLVVEDFDNHEDSDGCPDDDNDGDRRADGEDQCPEKAEDIDGFDDDDGCPELDNDGDGIADLEDRFCPLDKEDGLAPQASDGCPAGKRDTDSDGLYDPADACFDQEEDGDGFDDWDGCPDPDQDKDQVADEDDRCPVCPEDADGFDDGDGCPESDNDRDGLADGNDQCPAEAEVINGVSDFDGCPDEGGAEVATLEGDRIVFAGAIGFDKKKGLTKAGQLILDQAALIVLQHPEVTRWIIAVAAKKDAKKRGEWVFRHLVSRGVDASSLELKTSTGSDAVGMVVSERVEVEEGALPMCPAGHEVQQRTPEAGATSAPRSEPTPVDVLEDAPEPAPAKPAPAKPAEKTEPTKEDAVEMELE